MKRLIAVALVLGPLGLAACGGTSNAPPAMDDAMLRDLEAVQASAIEMAPGAERQQVVSAIEQTGRAQPRPTAPKPRAPQVAANVAQQQEPAPTPDPIVTQPAPVATAPTASRPAGPPKVSPPPPGGYKTVGEVIRNAPFPIKP